MRSAQREVERRRLGNKLHVLGKVNSLCEVGNLSLFRDIDSETVNFVIVIQDHHLIVPYVCKMLCVLSVRLSPGRVGPGIKVISGVIVARAKSV